MQLIGVEVESYAGFPKAFVPLSPGVNVLAGKNNSGKTALLRAATLLNTMSSRTIHPEVFSYFASPAATVRHIDVLFRLSQEDAHLMGRPSEWATFVATQRPFIRYQVQVQPRLGYGVCTIFGATGSAPLIVRHMNTLHRCKASTSLSSQLAEPLQGKTFSGQSGDYYSEQPIPELSNGFQIVGPVVLLDAHRSVPVATLQSVTELNPNAQNFAAFLNTLLTNNRREFYRIESFVTSVFPEFINLNPQSTNSNQVRITGSLKDGERQIALSNCGTGVEQILILATYVLSSKPGSIILIDEPHSYLHPAAERLLTEFLNGNAQHRYLIATHSPIIMNSVPSSAITYVERAVASQYESKADFSTAQVLTALGYRNSDFLFSDRLIFVEGASDQNTLPTVLRKLGKVCLAALETLGLPLMRGIPGGGKPGAGKKNVHSLQNSINRCEEFLTEMSRRAIPHTYLFDGDFTDEEKQQLVATAGGNLRIRFLARRELENYLVEPVALARVIQEEMRLFGISGPPPSGEEVENRIRKQLGKTNDNSDVFELCLGRKGSEILAGLFESCTLSYEKTRHDQLIAESVEDPVGAGWQEIWSLLADLFV